MGRLSRGRGTVTQVTAGVSGAGGASKAPKAPVAAAGTKATATPGKKVAELPEVWGSEAPTKGADLECRIDEDKGRAPVTAAVVEKKNKGKAKTPFNVVFVASECAPFSKTGGLGDVVGSVPQYLAERGHKLMVVVPLYGGQVGAELYGAKDTGVRKKVWIFGGEQEVAYFHKRDKGVDYVFVDHPSYDRPGNPYGDGAGAFDDNQFRFTLLSFAACEAPLVVPLQSNAGNPLGEDVIFVANDWHASLVPVYVASRYRPHGVYTQARTVTAIHNLSHQGVEPATTFKDLCIPDEWYGSVEWVFPEWARAHELDTGQAVNLLKGAIVTSDRVMTVSEGYAWEITTKEGGWGLDQVIQSRSYVLNGVVNGIDEDDWNPKVDKHLTMDGYANYDRGTLRKGKAECKAALQRELGLPVRPDVPVIAFIGRLDYQKGPDLVADAMGDLMHQDVQFVMLGSGDKGLEDWMRHMEMSHSDKFRGWVGFSVPMSHRITAGADIFLMPSRFEPCGLNQMYSMAYGTVPVCHAAGGLRDTVKNFAPGAGEGGADVGTGWLFEGADSRSMMGALNTALQTYWNYRDAFYAIGERGMECDFSWDLSAKKYEQIFEWAKLDPPHCG